MFPHLGYSYLGFHDLPFDWTHPKTWPWFIYVWLAFFLAGPAISLRRWLRREQAKSWPTSTGRIDSAYIVEPRRFFGLTLRPERSRQHVATLAYSYSLSGDTFRGEYKRRFASEEEANDFLRGLSGQSISVQRNPDRPSSSLVLESAVDTLLQNRAPDPNAPESTGWREPLPAWTRPLVGLFAFFALIGFLVSFWVHVGALLGRQVAPDSFFWGLHIGIFSVFFPAIFVAQRRIGRTQGTDFWKKVLDGSPDGLRILIYFFFAYALVNFFIFFFQTPPGKPHGAGPEVLQWRGFSGHWMVFYLTSFGILLSAYNSFRESRT